VIGVRAAERRTQRRAGLSPHPAPAFFIATRLSSTNAAIRTYLELEPSERIRYTNKFDAAALPGEMQTTIALSPVSCGTELSITQEGVPAAIPSEACYLGWQESLILLAQLVEAEIPDMQL